MSVFLQLIIFLKTTTLILEIAFFWCILEYEYAYYKIIIFLFIFLALQYSICDPQVEAYQLFDSIHNRHRDMYSNQNHLLNECLKDPWFVEIFGQDFSIESKNTSVQHQLRRLKRKWFSGQPLVDSQVCFKSTY